MTGLHLCKSPEVAELLLRAGAKPNGKRNNQGKTAYESQTPEIRALIDEITVSER